MPGLVVGSALSFVGEGWIGATDAGGAAATSWGPLLDFGLNRLVVTALLLVALMAR